MFTSPKTSTRCIALALVAACCAPLASRAADDSARLRVIVDKAIRPIMAEHDVPGMAVAVTVGGKAYFFNYGLASVKDQTPVSEATLFELGSVSKTLTATLASYALASGKLSLDAHPSAYMAQLKGSDIDKASVLNLGTYTAGGLPLQFPEEIKDAQMADYFQQWQAQAAPGTQRRYSNPSLGLFGHVTALALGSDFDEAMTQLFAQLGLTSSYLRVPAGAVSNQAWGYDEHNQARRMDPGVLAAPTYGVRSSSADMIRFMQVNIAPDQLDEPARRAVQGTHVGYFQVGAMVQGLGWEQYPWPVSLKRLQAGNSRGMIMEANAARRISAPKAPSAPTLFNKTGSTGGFGNYVGFVPAKKIAIVILANKNYPISDRVKAGHTILERLAP
ncbi:beta-lactamase [Massilia violaceinigra]|uniref:Beta-lactamase n=1 Tax=Massilia violaceinigra TaxID=2045208 RepID=A0ABY3ZZA2_9BURK|nr:class C beta-lactamase [Massilia violaceinigra]UOD27733.1 beta-lactamase [Massilia violaceinigra]